MIQKTPKLSIVGAGPGDPELVTLKAIRVLGEANVLLYDALTSIELHKYCKPDCEIIFVGKRAGEHSLLQDTINNLIVEKALTKGHVVRLKGGDPYVFGRGHEEMEIAKANGIAIEYIPGVTSAISVPGLVGIPATIRGVSDGFWVLTGTKSDKSLSTDLNLAMQSNSTVVLFMVMNKLDQVAKLYIENGKENMPVAIIQNGSLPNQKVVFGEILNLEKLAKENNMAPPALVVIGEVLKNMV
jgi:uroporphyrin-III C-methyltransferase